MREGEFVDIEIDAGAEVSCLPASIGADTCPPHETRLSMCVEVTTLRLVAANCMSSAPGSWGLEAASGTPRVDHRESAGSRKSRRHGETLGSERHARMLEASRMPYHRRTVEDGA